MPFAVRYWWGHFYANICFWCYDVRLYKNDHNKQFKVINMNKQFTVKRQTESKVRLFIETPSWNTFCQTEVTECRISRTHGLLFIFYSWFQNTRFRRTQITTIFTIHCILHILYYGCFLLESIQNNLVRRGFCLL